jgi:hypothetical protein
MFAKMFGKENNQVLVLLNANDDGKPSVKIMFEPSGLGVCSIGPAWEDTKEGWDRAEQVFKEMTEDKARDSIEQVCKDLGINEEGI